MNKRLQIQQYIELHPILSTDKNYRINYVSLIRYLSKYNTENTLWRESMLKLMQEKIMENEDFIPVEIISDKGIIFLEKSISNYKFKKYKYNILIDCLFINAFNDYKKGEKILERICEIFPTDRKKLTILFKKFYSVKMKKIGKEFSKIKEIYEIINLNRNFLKQSERVIVVTGNMSSGKSTLLNALTGKKLTKTQNDSCTAKVHYLYNKAGEDNLIYELDKELELNASKEIIMEDNQENDSIEIYVGTKFRSITDLTTRICFVDTPGVNSSRDKEHKEITKRVIEKKGKYHLLIFLFNGENIGTEDDARYLNYIREVYTGDILFLVNKLDSFKKGEDSISETLQKVKDNLLEIGFNSPKVYPISAYAAYLAKMTIFGEKLNEDEMDDINFRKRKLSLPEFRYDKYFENQSFEIEDENKELLRNSGILALEEIIYKSSK